MKHFFYLLLCSTLLIHNATAQSNNSKTKSKTITIAVKDTEYDDPAFDNLRKMIKTNMRATDVTPGFAGGVAKISLSYQGNASELWDEIPQSAKQSFKVTGITDTHIDLQLKPVTNQNTTAISETKKEECIDCYYYKVCKPDTTISYRGESLKAYKGKAGWYFCKNGVLYTQYISTDKKITTQIILKAYEPQGSNWFDTTTSGLIYKNTTISKGITVKYGKTTYPDVMIVYKNYGTLIYNYYYGKEVGYFKADTLDSQFNPAIAATLQGNVDTSMIGLWKYYHSGINMNLYYQFDGDGTCKYYAGSVNSIDQNPKGITYWRVSGNAIELYNGVWSNITRMIFQKKNDVATGKPAIVLGNDKESWSFVSESAKPAWK